MKKTWIAAAALAGFAAVVLPPAVAQFQPDPNLTTAPIHQVASARKLADDAPVTLEGNIKRHIRGDRYEFVDTTGSIDVKIEQKHWNGQVVNPKTRVRLTGEVDKDLLSTKVDVKRLEVVTAQADSAAKPPGGFRPN